MAKLRIMLVWSALGVVIAVPVIAAAASPLLAWREPIYIAAGFAGIIAMALLLVQPLLAGRYLPGLTALRARQLHRAVGGILVLAVIIHVAALWITSPPDVIDVLLFVSPTPFSLWGVIAMWALFAAALMAAFKARLRLRPPAWRFAHAALAAVTIIGSVVHALLIEGTMETISKAVLCAAVVAAFAKLLADLRARAVRLRRLR